MPNPQLDAATEEELRKLMAKVELHVTSNISIDELEVAITRLLLLQRQEELHGVQVYTDPSHQKMSPFTRLKTADKYINDRLAQIDKGGI